MKFLEAVFVCMVFCIQASIAFILFLSKEMSLNPCKINLEFLACIVAIGAAISFRLFYKLLR